MGPLQGPHPAPSGCTPKPEAAAKALSAPVPGPWDNGAMAGPEEASEDQPGQAAGPPAPWGGLGQGLCPGDGASCLCGPVIRGCLSRDRQVVRVPVAPWRGLGQGLCPGDGAPQLCRLQGRGCSWWAGGTPGVLTDRWAVRVPADQDGEGCSLTP